MNRVPSEVVILIRGIPQAINISVLKQALTSMGTDPILEGYLLGVGRPPMLKMGAVHDLTFTTQEQFAKDAEEWLVKAEAPPIRTPLTKENLTKWAKEQVRAEKAESPVLALAEILRRYNEHSYGDYKAHELVEVVSSFIMDGCKGYKQYTMDEILDEIDSELIDPSNSAYEFHDLEDLLEEFSMV